MFPKEIVLKCQFKRCRAYRGMRIIGSEFVFLLGGNLHETYQWKAHDQSFCSTKLCAEDRIKMLWLLFMIS